MTHANWQLIWAILLVLFLAGLGAGFQVGNRRGVDLKKRPTQPQMEDLEGQPITHLSSLPVYCVG